MEEIVISFFRRARVAVFVDGDFWHGRNWDDRKSRLAEGANPGYWINKIEYAQEQFMSFYTEPEQYRKTILSDLQGAWENLRESVVQNRGFQNWDRLLFHIDEAMSWESVRDLDRMRSAVLLIQNIAAQAQVPDEVLEWIETVKDDLEEVLAAVARGETL